MGKKNYKPVTVINFILWSAGYSLLWVEGFSCSLDVFYGCLGINKLQLLIKKRKETNFICIFFNLHSSQPWSVSASGFIWRIRIQLIRIYNTGARSRVSYMFSLELGGPCFSLNLDRARFRFLITKGEKFMVGKTLKTWCAIFAFLAGFKFRIQNSSPDPQHCFSS